MEDLIRASLDHCVKCTICETACPVAQVTPLFPGPKYEGPQAERLRQPAGTADASVDYCSGCGICTQVCPHGVKIAEINSRARARYKEEKGVRARDRIVARPGLTGRLGTPVAPLTNRVMASGTARRLIERTVGIHHAAAVPSYPGHSFQRWARLHQRRVSPRLDGRTVVYFHGCSVNWFEPDLGRMVVAVLERNGVEVRMPRQGCCGLPLQSNGLFDGARKALTRLARDLTAGGREDPVVASSTSCGLMLKREGREILGLVDEGLSAVGRRTFDVCEYLLDLHGRGLLDTGFQPLPLTVVYHAACQQRGHGMGTPALDLLGLIPELRVLQSDADCCGMAGTYGVKKEKYEIAMAVGERLFAQVRRVEPDVVACDGETCRWQITEATGRASLHPVELLFRAYGLEL
jgi:glycerol-3-phosphate dehydrogenase subunit C